MDETHNCSKCRSEKDVEATKADGSPVCISCWIDCQRDEEDSYHQEAREFAFTHCKVTGVPHLYDSTRRSAPSPEEYANGDKEAYTVNAVAAYNRHNETNYDELIKGLSREVPRDRAYYAAIRERIDELIEIALEMAGEERIDELIEIALEMAGEAGSEIVE